MRRAAIVLAVVSLAGCNTVGPTTPHALSPTEIAWVEAGVRAQMKDPASAQFRDIRGARNARGETLVCGWFNGRNSFGGYSGFVPFSGTLTDTFRVGMTGEDINDAVTIGHQCRRAGIDI